MLGWSVTASQNYRFRVGYVRSTQTVGRPSSVRNGQRTLVSPSDRAWREVFAEWSRANPTSTVGRQPSSTPQRLDPQQYRGWPPSTRTSDPGVASTRRCWSQRWVSPSDNGSPDQVFAIAEHARIAHGSAAPEPRTRQHAPRCHQSHMLCKAWGCTAVDVAVRSRSLLRAWSRLGKDEHFEHRRDVVAEAPRRPSSARTSHDGIVAARPHASTVSVLVLRLVGIAKRSNRPVRVHLMWSSMQRKW